LAVGTLVTVNYRKSGNWYAGAIAAAHANGTYDIAYDDGDGEKAAKREHIKVTGDPSADAAAAAAAASAGSLVVPSAAVVAAAAAAPAVAAAKMKAVVALLGVPGAGKSTLLRAMGGDPDPKPRPTTGFGQKQLPFELTAAAASGAGFAPEALVHWYDLPGGWQGKWAGYLGEAHAIVFVVDAAADDATFAVAQRAFRAAVGGSDSDDTGACARVVAGKPLLLLCNKQDAPGARSAEAVAAAFFGDDAAGVRAQGCCCHPMKAPGGAFDGRVELGLEWLLSETAQRFGELDGRVQADRARADEARAAEKVDRHRRVMTKVLAEKAFPPQGTPALETFSEVDGFEFLAMELLVHDPQVAGKTRTAEEQWGLSKDAQRVAQLVGFQKMAMIMCADMINPERKPGKATHSWAEVAAYVMDRRQDAGLPRDLEE
jgi:signal recognition particle receptor subunit beta